MVTDEILRRLFSEQDREYRDFQARLIPGKTPENMIGVRTPVLKTIAREYAGHEDIGIFLSSLPHTYFDEDQLHAFLISSIRSFDECAGRVDAFLPYIDNWATCDQLSPAIFRKHREALLPLIRKWIESDRTFTVRFAFRMLMVHFLDSDFRLEYVRLAASVRSDSYYVNMMAAWYFATALAKQYEAVLPFIEGRRLEPWTHNKAIQKALESRRITPEQKEYLRGLKARHV